MSSENPLKVLAIVSLCGLLAAGPATAATKAVTAVAHYASGYRDAAAALAPEAAAECNALNLRARAGSLGSKDAEQAAACDALTQAGLIGSDWKHPRLDELVAQGPGPGRLTVGGSPESLDDILQISRKLAAAEALALDVAAPDTGLDDAVVAGWVASGVVTVAGITVLALYGVEAARFDARQTNPMATTRELGDQRQKATDYGIAGGVVTGAGVLGLIVMLAVTLATDSDTSPVHVGPQGVVAGAGF
ncbi:MAG: hypothetical protein AMXMBFR64_27740 [Myxococcales bacterium]